MVRIRRHVVGENVLPDSKVEVEPSSKKTRRAKKNSSQSNVPSTDPHDVLPPLDLKDKNSVLDDTSVELAKPLPSPAKDEAVKETECVICMEDKRDANFVGILNCKHDFCFDCIENWAKHENTCPLCKVAFTSISKQVGVNKAKADQEREERAMAKADADDAGKSKRSKKRKRKAYAPPKPVSVKVQKKTQAETYQQAQQDARDAMMSRMMQMLLPGRPMGLPMGLLMGLPLDPSSLMQMVFQQGGAGLMVDRGSNGSSSSARGNSRSGSSTSNARGSSADDPIVLDEDSNENRGGSNNNTRNGSSSSSRNTNSSSSNNRNNSSNSSSSRAASSSGANSSNSSSSPGRSAVVDLTSGAGDLAQLQMFPPSFIMRLMEQREQYLEEMIRGNGWGEREPYPEDYYGLTHESYMSDGINDADY